MILCFWYFSLFLFFNICVCHLLVLLISSSSPSSSSSSSSILGTLSFPISRSPAEDRRLSDGVGGHRHSGTRGYTSGRSGDAAYRRSAGPRRSAGERFRTPAAQPAAPRDAHWLAGCHVTASPPRCSCDATTRIWHAAGFAAARRCLAEKLVSRDQTGVATRGLGLGHRRNCPMGPVTRGTHPLQLCWSWWLSAFGPLLANGCHFRWAPLEAYSASPDLAKFDGRRKELGKGVGGDGEGTEEENEGDRLPPHVRSPSTFQPCYVCLAEKLVSRPDWSHNSRSLS